jgi:hypothetical protein
MTAEERMRVRRKASDHVNLTDEQRRNVETGQGLHCRVSTYFGITKPNVFFPVMIYRDFEVFDEETGEPTGDTVYIPVDQIVALNLGDSIPPAGTEIMVYLDQGYFVFYYG